MGSLLCSPAPKACTNMPKPGVYRAASGHSPSCILCGCASQSCALLQPVLLLPPPQFAAGTFKHCDCRRLHMPQCPSPTTRMCLAKALPGSPQMQATGLRARPNLTLASFPQLPLPWKVTMEYSMKVTLGFLMMPTQYIVLMATSQIHFVKSQ